MLGETALAVSITRFHAICRRSVRFHLKIDHVKGHDYGRLVRTVREGDRTRQVTLVQLGPVTSEQIPRIKAWLDTDPTCTWTE